MLQPLTACHRGSGLSFAMLMTLMLIPVLTQVLCHLKWCPESSDHQSPRIWLVQKCSDHRSEGVVEGLFLSIKTR
ncbi:MAG: hypothetical protein GYB20_03075 [Oceanospirillales bacterium]|nr:hypothetical protein [Oceanospirillales bacterium]MBR9886673.1 hypothetical protein [Oceanospirillales bacterium]